MSFQHGFFQTSGTCARWPILNQKNSQANPCSKITGVRPLSLLLPITPFSRQSPIMLLPFPFYFFLGSTQFTPVSPATQSLERRHVYVRRCLALFELSSRSSLRPIGKFSRCFHPLSTIYWTNCYDKGVWLPLSRVLGPWPNFWGVRILVTPMVPYSYAYVLAGGAPKD